MEHLNDERCEGEVARLRRSIKSCVQVWMKQQWDASVSARDNAFRTSISFSCYTDRDVSYVPNAMLCFFMLTAVSQVWVSSRE